MMTQMGGAPDWESVLRVVHTVSLVEDLDDFGSTVLEHVYRKLGVSTATAAVAQAVDALTS